MSRNIIAALWMGAVIGCAPAKDQNVEKPLFSESEITFPSGGIALAGTLTKPSVASGKLPAMLLIPGSGPTDRDGNSGAGLTAMRTDLLKQIAVALAKQGVATLRFDKRATQRYRLLWPNTSEGLNKFFSYKSFIDDAKSAYVRLRAEAGIDPHRVGIIGHSEGGLYALQIASDGAGTEKEPWKLVLMSTAGRSFGPIVHEQLAFRLKLANASPEETNRFLRWWDGAAKAVAAGKPLPPDQPVQLKSIVNPTVMDLMKAYCKIDPAVLLQRTSMPVLILNGSDDTQVSPTLDAVRLNEVLKKRKQGSTGNLLIISGVSHNYKSTAGGNKDSFEGAVDPTAVKSIVDFVGLK